MTATILTPDTVPALYVVRDRIRFFSPVEGTDLKLVEVEILPGSGSPPHRHASPETFRILEGEVTFGLFAPGRPPEQVAAGPGAVVRVEAWSGHNYANLGAMPARMLVILDDSMIGFFEDLGAATMPEAGPPSEAEVGVIMAGLPAPWDRGTGRAADRLRHDAWSVTTDWSPPASLSGLTFH